MSPSPCAVNKCDRLAFAHGYCQKHLYRFKRYGDPLFTTRASADSHSPYCSVKGCGKPYYGRGYCARHYRQWKTHGNPCIFKRTPNGEGKSYITTKHNGKTLQRHRLIVEDHIGRPLKPSEIVHHKDENKRHNSIDNLEITNRSDHAKMHLLNSHPLRKNLPIPIIFSLYNEGKSMKSIAKSLKISRELVSKVLKSEHWSQRKENYVAPVINCASHRPNRKVVDVEKILTLRESGLSFNDIGKLCNISRSTVESVIKGTHWSQRKP